MMGADYVLGIEPTNNRLLGRGELKKQNLLKYIEPGEAVCFRIEANFLPRIISAVRFIEQALTQNDKPGPEGNPFRASASVDRVFHTKVALGSQ